MLSVTSSDSIAQIASSAYRWPQTTNPFINAIVINGANECSYIQTICAVSALEFAFGVEFEDNTYLTLHCCLVIDGSWVLRTINEVHVGELGDAAVVVFRDDQNIDFCPDAPMIPASQVTGLTLVCASIGHKPVDRPLPVESFEHKLFRGLKIRQAKEQGGSPETPAVSTSTSN